MKDSSPSIMARWRFPKSARLLKSSEFERVFDERNSAADGLIVVYAARGLSEQPRLGLTVSRKCGNAVVRNHWKRSLREAFRLVQHDLPRYLDLVILPRPGASPDVASLQISFVSLASQLSKKLDERGDKEPSP